jgi:hypothetical protein
VAEKKSTEVPIKEKKPCAPETLDEVDALKDAVSKQQATVSLVQRWNKVWLLWKSLLTVLGTQVEFG